ncbi:methylated-DNA--[protein]-cysteine S-methyltransferase [Thiocystis violacea]|uniref:methylated-DNA--[protein]-cysteine S-methyltransferase n=1 Tax=Thiocystis violacea TaxID=13725 RepID=UPI001906FBAD|nr:methylated-DNA--[protein]-cysteine S-methyltransferase [Thiocystis violacea]MBK1719557.1 cysteine methyltransferase [Thiocystis violacea]
MSHALIDSPIGSIALHWRGEVLTGVEIDPAISGQPAPDAGSVMNRQEEEAAGPPPSWITRPLSDYFERAAFTFDLPLELEGTPFQQRVWAVLRAIPAGRTRTYGEVAEELGSAARAVGQACRANPCPIVVPCHRVVGRRGLGGFAGDTSGRRIAVKRWLLDHEGAPHAG